MSFGVGRTAQYYGTPTPTALAVTAISPDTGLTPGGEPVEISGRGFELGMTAKIDGVLCTDLVVRSANRLTCVTPAGTAGAKNVRLDRTVTTANATLTNGFTYSLPVPQLDSIDVDESEDWETVAVELTGLYLTGATGVEVGGVPATSVVVVDDEHVTCVFPARVLASTASEAVDVAVTTGGGTDTLEDAFTYTWSPYSLESADILAYGDDLEASPATWTNHGAEDDLTITTGVVAPTRIAGANGFTALHCQGASRADADADLPLTDAGWSLMTVMRVVDAAGGPYRSGMFCGDTPGVGRFTDGKLHLFIYGVADLDCGAITLDAWHLVEVHFTPAGAGVCAVAVFVDGVSVFTDVGQTYAGTTAPPQFGGVVRAPGQVDSAADAEVDTQFIFLQKTPLAAGDITDVRTYLTDKYL